MDKKPTIAELEAILDGAAKDIRINPDGSLTTVTSDTEKINLIRDLVEKPLSEGELPDYRKIFYCIQNILDTEKAETMRDFLKE